MNNPREQASTPEDLTRLFTELANARDAEGLAALYEPDAMLAYPPGQTTKGREAICAVYERMVAMGLHFEFRGDVAHHPQRRSRPDLDLSARRSRDPRSGGASPA
jgi:uncharacterized protein (TIGR02246 family)